MNWEQARKLFRWQARHGQNGRAGECAVGAVEPLGAVRAASLCVASGKGGTGKSVVTASLGALFARRARTLLVDADLGVGNAHILQNLCPEHSFADVIEGRLALREIRVRCRERLDLLPGGSGFSRLAGLSAYEMHVVACGLEELEVDYDQVLIDSAAGISNQTLAFAAGSDTVLLVTTPDVTAMTDAYAFLKVLLQRRPDIVPLFVVNRATSAAEGRHVAERIVAVAHKFLGREPRYLGWLPDDPHVLHSVNTRTPVVLQAADSPFATAVQELFVPLLRELERVGARGVGRQMLRTAGYTPGL